MMDTYDRDVTAVEISPLRELEEAGSMLEVTREKLDQSRDAHTRAVARWDAACKAAAEWIDVRQPDRQNEQKAAR